MKRCVIIPNSLHQILFPKPLKKFQLYFMLIRLSFLKWNEDYGKRFIIILIFIEYSINLLTVKVISIDNWFILGVKMKAHFFVTIILPTFSFPITFCGFLHKIFLYPYKTRIQVLLCMRGKLCPAVGR